jgi:excisionase family DNA binding protein
MGIDVVPHDPLYTIEDAQVTAERVPVALPSGAKSGVLVAPDGQEVALDPGVYEILDHVLEQLKDGKAVRVISYGKDLTTQQAADILNISRQYLIRLLDRNEIPYTRVGSHRRLRVDDVLAYRRRRSAVRHEALNNLTRASQEIGDY